MLDIKLIRENTESVEKALEKRGKKIMLDELLDWDKERRSIVSDMESLQAKRNKASQEFGQLKAQKKEIPEDLSLEINKIRESIKDKERFLISLEQKIEDFLLRLPNIPDKTVPVGKDASANKEVRVVGKKKKFNFKTKPHWEIGENLEILDFKTAAKISGARFSLLKGDGCVMERALINFMTDTHRKRGYMEVYAPYLVNRDSIQGTGQLPKFEEEVFRCKDDDLYLIPTSEVSVTNIHRDEFIPESELPKKYVSYSSCFRREAGSYGKDTRGLIRNHQFNKIELVKCVDPKESDKELESLTNDAEEVLKLLGLTYRVLLLSTGDMGFGAAKTYDIEVWMPGENMWREISSCSNYKDFQSRRMNIKLRRSDKKKEYIHTLNGSGVAVGRVFAAILENYQNEDGSVTIPEVLREYTKIDTIKN